MGKTIAQKIFDSHIVDDQYSTTVILKVDKIFAHEITTPPAIQDLKRRGMDSVFDSDKIKVVIDHISPSKDTQSAIQAKILREWAKDHNITDFFDVGQNGVCHALFPEKGFVRPGDVIIMGDSHTCTHGAFGAFAFGVGTTALEVGLLKGITAMEPPKSTKIQVIGTLQPGVYAKDVILWIIHTLTVNGATNTVIEFTGEVIEGFSMEERMTVSNMAVEAGATSGIIAPDMKTVQYLWPFISKHFHSDKAKALDAYTQWNSDADAEYVKELIVDVSRLDPLITVGYSPDSIQKAKDVDIPINQAYIGSCTNGRISDLRVAAQILKHRKINPNVRGIIAPATTQVYRQALEEGLIQIFMDAGFAVTSTTCGACLGMSNGVMAPGEIAVSSTNRNFNGRMGKGAMVHLASPATVAASALTGRITDPRAFLEES